MNVNEQITFHSEKSTPLTKYSIAAKGIGGSLINNQSTDGKKINSFSIEGVSRVKKAIGIAFFILFSMLTYAQSVQFNLIGAEQDWVVPANVSCVTLEVWGAQGENNIIDATPGGKGGFTTGTLNVTPGEVLYINVGGAGNLGFGGFNGGGDGSPAGIRGAGGGASDVRQGANTLNARVIVAGGGGGAGDLGRTGGAGGGTNGADGFDNGNNDGPGGFICDSGGGGTQIGGGISLDAQPGSSGQGGNSLNIGLICSGGGGGWFGGGAGNGAGGGSGYTGGVNGGFTLPGIKSGNGLVIISYSTLALDCPGNLIFNLGSGECSKEVNLDIEVEGSCGGAIISSPTGHSTGNNDFPIGETVVEFEATENGALVTCTFTVTVVENQAGEMSCGDQINIILDENCQFEFTADYMLTGNNNQCFNNYDTYVMFDIDGPLIPTSPIITDEYIGQTLVGKVCDSDGDCCWGYILVEDKTLPEICCADFTMSCTADTDPEDITGGTKTYDPVEDLPVIIPEGDDVEASVTDIHFEIEDCEYDIIDLNVFLDITHENVGDLSAELRNLSGSIVVPLFNRPGNPLGSCGTGDISTTFDDESTTPTDFQDDCPSITGGTYLPLSPLSAFDGELLTGEYIIRITDNNINSNGGTINGASLIIEAAFGIPIASDACDGVLEPELVFEDFSDPDCGGDCYQTITRIWCTTDESGNENCCEQIICLTKPTLDEVDCPPDYDGFCPDDPLESLWLQELIADCALSPCGTEVSSCTYLGDPVIVISQAAPCVDGISSVYSCGSGEFIFEYGGIGGINLDLAADLLGCTVIFNCGDALPAPSKAPMLTCTDNFPTDLNGNPHPDFTGYPTIKGNPVEGECMLYCIYEDEPRIDVCEGSYIIVRSWTCYDWCPGADPAEIECDQVIKVIDNDPPTIECPDDRTESAGPDCSADVILDPPTVLTDDCSPLGLDYTIDHDEGVLSINLNGDYVLSGLPLGVHIITYIAEDGCGNTASCSYTITIEDDQAPPCFFSSFPDLYITGNGNDIPWTYFVDPDALTDLDNCSNPVTAEVRRLNMPFCPGDDSTPFGNFVPFSCCDVGNTVIVEIRLTDQEGNASVCSTTIDVFNNENPGITCPPDKEIDCNNYQAEILGNYDGVTPDDDNIPDVPAPGPLAYFVADDLSETFVGYYDNVSNNCGVTVYITDGFLGVDDCGNSVNELGQLAPFERTYTVEDNSGNSNSCIQYITIVNQNPFNPDTDIAPFPTVESVTCENIGNVIGPDISGYQGCDENRIRIEQLDDMINPDPGNGNCFQILRQWEVFNDCIDPNTPVTTLNQTINVTDAADPIISCSVIADEVVEGDDLVFSASATSCTDAYSPPLTAVSFRYEIDQGNDDPNNPEEDGNGTLGTVPTGPLTIFPVGEHLVTFIATDHCGNEVRCSLVVTVINPLTCDDVVSNFPFEANVGLSDPHLVFASETGLYVGGAVPANPEISLTPPPFNTTSISFNCNDIVGNSDTPILVYLEFDDGTGGRLVCEKTITLVDQSNPIALCKEVQNIGPIIIDSGVNGGVHEFTKDDIDDGSTDNLLCTATNDLVFSFSPLSVSCDDLQLANPAFINVTMTVTDLFGNSGSCPALVPVQTNDTPGCSPIPLAPPTFNVSGGIENEEGSEVEYVAVEVEGDNLQDIAMTGDDGAFGFNLPSIENYVITPERDDNILNGVSTYDLVLISKHILQFDPLSSPYKIIAADVNHSGTVSTIDMVALRKVILFIDDEFPNNTSWRFVDAEFVFPDPTNPFSTSFPEVYTINGLTEDQVANFVGVKIGDVNCSGSPNDLISGDDRNAEGELIFTLANQSLKAGETYQFDFEATDFDQVQGFQFTMNFDADAIEFNDVEAGDLDNISNGNFGLHKLNEGIITASWNTLEDAQTLENGKVLFSLSFTALNDGQLSDLIKISSRFTKAEAYNHEGLLDLSLQFVDESGIITADQFELYQNQPNPFKDETVVGFYLPESGKATFKVFDISGREIKTIEGDYSKGYNEISLNRSELQSRGVLYYQLESAENIASKKMVLLD